MSTSVLLGCIADDVTGATDLANTLVRGGMRAVQTIGTPSGALNSEAEAVVVALKSRTCPVAEAVTASLEALRWLQAQGCRQFYFKYCSTFDSTPEGNIGPVLEALMKALGVSFAIACPAFPENGRTMYRGHLFVGDALLNESGLEHHPLTPMTDPNLVRFLQRQAKGKVGLLRYDVVRGGVEAVREARSRLREEGVSIAIADAISEADLMTIAAACADDLLFSGGSGLALGLPENFRRKGLLPYADNASILPAIHGGEAVLAGSCSRATQAQVEYWQRAAKPSFRIDAFALADGQDVVVAAVEFAENHHADGPVLIYATSTAEEIELVHKKLGSAKSGALIEDAMGRIACELRKRGVRKMIVAGGETSGAVVAALGVTVLQIGPQIDPGVPWTMTLGNEPLALALKSGNFGGEDFFERAFACLKGDVA
jgi:3-dehydrotetronate 4-kinase